MVSVLLTNKTVINLNHKQQQPPKNNPSNFPEMCLLTFTTVRTEALSLWVSAPSAVRKPRSLQSALLSVLILK